MITTLFASKTVKQGVLMLKHVRKVHAAQRDIITAQANATVSDALRKLEAAINSRAGDDAVKVEMENVEAVATKWLKAYPNPGIRENVEVLLVALAVAMGIRTFFAQPFKIPTGSMQPTLFGVTHEPLETGADGKAKMPGTLGAQIDFWLHGVSYVNILAPEDGELQMIRQPQKLLLFNLKQEYEFNNKWYTVWFPPDDLFVMAERELLDRHKNLMMGTFKAGEPIAQMKVTAGDHLFVDRMTYNFRQPKRGEIIVFETKGIGVDYNHALPPDQFYIKRLVGLSGEQVQIGEDRHLIIDGKRLDKTTPHFENVYSFSPNESPQPSHYSGHVPYPMLAPVFAQSPNGVFTIPTNYYMAMGDNTLESSDSRYWGPLPRTNVIGKYLMVYWPFSSRFGFGVK